MLARLGFRTGAIVLAFVLLLAAENLVIGYGYRSMFTGSWEMAYARLYASPIALAALLPLAAALAGWTLWLERAPVAASRTMAGVLAVGAGVALALAPTGRLFGAWPARAGLGVVAALIGFGIASLIVRVGRARLERQPRQVVGAALLLAALAWAVDAFAFARQYPTLHALAAVICLLGTSVGAIGLGRMPGKLAAFSLLFALATWPWTLHAARALHHADNLRLVLLEHAPLLGRGVALGARLSPLPPDVAAETETTAAQVGRTLHWNDRSLLVITVDALRADHVSAYGYDRNTTPRFDALAKDSALFEYAYCPTPHTSYSISSLMTGKYMHPLRAMGLGEDSETWADLYRHYGFRTAAFYPPAVFFVDEDRFERFREQHVGFEYYKVEFATSEVRVAQVAEYLKQAPPSVPLFVWVHLFDPHEPYVYHPEKPFGTGLNPSAMDAYDSEIAVADETLGRIVEMFDAARPDNVLVVSADHGEEFGEHGGRYHGSSVYEEQVRVPLIVRGAGVRPGRVRTPVQTIDLLPTFLSASGTPRPPRLRGRDLGSLLIADKSVPLNSDEGFAFAEVIPLAMVARGTERLVCRRAENACALYDVAVDPKETKDLGASRPERVRQLRGLWQRTELDHGRLEGDRGARFPAALRRGLQGDRDAAPEVAALLDDVDVNVRKTAARVLVKLAAEDTVAQLERVLGHETDKEVRGLIVTALTRTTRTLHPDLADFAVATPSLDSRRLAAMALAERGNGSRVDVLLDALERDGKTEGPAGDSGEEGADLEEDEAIGIVHALVALHEASPEPARTAAMARTLARRLSDVRLRPHLVRALGQLGDVSVRPALLEVFLEERNFAARQPEAEALLALRAQGDVSFERTLERFAGMPEPIPGALALARRARLLTPARGGYDLVPAKPSWSGRWPAKVGPAGRVFVELAAPGAVTVSVGGSVRQAVPLAPAEGDPIPGGSSYAVDVADGAGEVRLDAESGLRAVWIVPLTAELPPPPPQEWDAGAP